MKNNYTLVKQLLDLLGEFEDEHNRFADIQGFAEWLITRIREEPLEKNSFIRRKSGSEILDIDLSESLDEKGRFLDSISRIARLHDFFTRKYLAELPLNNRLEYMFLWTIARLGNAKKTDLIHIHMVEYTTCMDTIRRLVNGGLLEEMPNESDKRARLVTLSAKGRELLQVADARIDEERNMFLSCISSNRWKKALPVLEEISSFHQTIYSDHYEKPAAELTNLMDSLKHLYK